MDAWKKALETELKLSDVSQKLFSQSVEGQFAILSLQSQSPGQIGGQVIPNATPWKKASQTYFSSDFLAGMKLDAALQDDLANGVRLFFFADDVAAAVVAQARTIFATHPDSADIEVVILGGTEAPLSALEIATQGGTHLQEVARLTLRLIEWANHHPSSDEVVLALSVDHHFFQSIAKIRAVREVAAHVFSELKREVRIKIISIVNRRDWTLYDRYNNVLRNSVAVSAALVGGADAIQSLGYLAPFETEVDPVANTAIFDEHLERSRRLARNTIHVLSLESLLGMVQDAAAGSFHLETLTEHYARESWELMRQWVNQPVSEQDEFFKNDVSSVRNERLRQFHHRRLILSGVNEYPNVKERLGVKGDLKTTGFRLAREFELLRLRVERLKPSQVPVVRILFWGDYAAMNGRLNFTQNYFETLGLTVLEPGHSIQDDAAFSAWASKGDASSEIRVWCAKDADYPELCSKWKSADEKAFARFIAGKVEQEGLQAIFAGQDIHAILSTLVSRMEARS